MKRPNFYVKWQLIEKTQHSVHLSYKTILSILNIVNIRSIVS